MSDKIISIPVKEIAHLKVMLATWYAFLRDQADSLSNEEFSRFLNTPVILDLEKDEIQLMFTGTEDLLNRFKKFIQES